MDSVFGMGARGVVSTVACIVLASWFLGAGLHVFLKRFGFSPRGVAFTVGLGLVSASFLIEMGYYLVGNVFAFLIPVALASFGYTIFRMTLAVRGDKQSRDALRSLVPTSTDWLTGIATLVVLYPLIRLGLVYFTDGINDFPNYAAAAEQWLSTSGVGPDFLFKHPDEFGPYQLVRAETEKPASTATFVFAILVSGVPGYALLGPIVVVTVLVLVGNVAGAIQRAFRSSALVAAAAALIPALSIIPMSRLHDAQVGHAIAVAYLAVLIHSALILHDASVREDVDELDVAGGRRQTAIAVTVSGVLLATTIGANATLILGAGVSWGALVLWLAYQTAASWRFTLRRYAAASAAALLFSVPALTGYRRSLSSQVGGAQGSDIPLPSPLAVVGLQFDLNDVAGTGQMLTAWAFVIVATVVATVVFAGSRSYWATLFLGIAIVLNGAIIMARVGTVNYATHKWQAVVIAVVTPFLIARLVSLVPSERRYRVEMGLCALAVASSVVSWRSSDDVPVRVPLTVMNLAENADLADLDAVNVQLDDAYRNTIAAMAVPSEQVIVAGAGYAEPAAPIGDQFLLDLDTAVAWGAEEAIGLSDDMVLASIDLTAPLDEPALFDLDHLDSGRFLYGHWFDIEQSGVWTNRRYNRLAVDIPPELQGEDVAVVLHGTRLANADRPRELIVRLENLDGLELVRATFDEVASRDVRVIVGADAVAAGNGRIVLHLETPDAIRARELGYDDDRTLGFLLQSLTVGSAE